ncbi:D-malate degradation protein R [Serratia quinivorans]|jgi:DNA-binding transcriptional LysR family regulator|uniref:Transcriptional regulator, LysR family n=1 Tax=Serratia proteamaculans (strain 568) TaxID=399741 RepID=A8GJH0_SERP5|nr:LysR family transcriptional regulator [Serratia quinivorans]CAI1120721.1 D-malate degradation protein R [Serratia quinivorans]CAI1875793.1 D-malate degradation protein R [Serratia quinivorans]CAI1898824.1 D-malate degradation protein R [Serratia quinivorans]
MRTDLKGIPVFVAVVECGNFAQAAQDLNITRSAVGKAIARLEERLGVTLFQRTTRNQTLTEEGEILYQQSRIALDCIREAEDVIHLGKTQVKGRLRISLPVLLGQRCIAPILLTIAKSYPQLKLELSFNDRQVNLFDEGFDLAVRIGELADSSFLQARRLGQHGMILCASAQYLKTHLVPRTLSELQEHPAIGYQLGGKILNWQLNDMEGREINFRPNTVLAADDFVAIAAAVISDLGVAWLPDWLVSKEIAQGQIQQILPECTSMKFAISAVWLEAAWMPQKIRIVIDELLAKLPEQIFYIPACGTRAE